MKITLMFLLSILLGKGCESEKAQELESAVIEYTANTRGFYERITISNRTVEVSADRKGQDTPTPVKITDADWKTLVETFDKVKLDEVPTLKAPSEKRFYDGAAIAQLKITYKDKTYETPEFDHGNPNVAIAALVAQIQKYSNRK
jgi:hypothetical protein